MPTFARLLAIALVPVLASAAHADIDAVALLRAGLGPRALAAAGTTTQEVAAVIGDVRASDAALNGDLEAADGAVRSAKQGCNALAKKVKGGNSSAQDKADYQTAKSSVAQAEADRQAVLDTLFAAGIADLTAAKQATLTQLRANMARRGFPTELLAVSRTDKEWIQLRKCLAHEKVCLEDGEEVHADVATQLAAWRAVAAVATAKALLDANLASITSAWNDAANG